MGSKKNRLKKSVGWKIQLTMNVNFISSKDRDDKRLIHSKSDNTEIIIGNKTDDLFNHFLPDTK